MPKILVSITLSASVRSAASRKRKRRLRFGPQRLLSITPSASVRDVANRSRKQPRPGTICSAGWAWTEESRSGRAFPTYPAACRCCWSLGLATSSRIHQVRCDTGAGDDGHANAWDLGQAEHLQFVLAGRELIEAERAHRVRRSGGAS